MNTAYQQARSLKQELLPQAQKAYAQSRDGYERGNFSYLEVLDAQRTLAETRLQYITLLENYHQAKIRVDRLSGQYAPYINE
jgi:cobalt-zinc-cadmium efflux system outer membrane protein